MKYKYLIIIWLSLCHLMSWGQETYTLQEAVDYALQHHKSLTSQRMEGERARWQYKQALSIGLPRINGNIDYSYLYKVPVQPTPDFLTPIVTEIVTGMPYQGETQYLELAFARKNQLNLGISGEVLVFDGNFLQGLKGSKMFIDLAEKQIQLTEQEVIQNVVQAYQGVLIAKRNLSIIDDNLGNLDKIYSDTKVMYDNGFVEELDLFRIKLSQENLASQREKIAQGIDIATNVLKFQMAYPLAQPLDVADDIEGVLSLMDMDITMTDSIDYAARPEHRLMVDAIALDYADLKRIKQGYLPSVSAFASYGQGIQRDKLFDGNEVGFIPTGAVGLRATIPIYDGGRTKSLMEQKKIDIEKRKIELSEFDRAMHLQIINAITKIENASSVLNRAETTMDLNQQIYDRTKIKYTEGVGSSIEVSQAEANLYSSQATYINALYDLLTARTELAIARGALLK